MAGKPDEGFATDRDRLLRLIGRLAEAERLASFGSFEWDVARNDLLWSSGMYPIYGVDPATFTPTYENFLALIHPDDRDHMQDVIAELLHGGPSPADLEERIVRPDGTVRWLESRIERLPERGAPERIVGTCHDVSELRAARHEKELATRRLALIFERITDAFMALDREWRYTYINSVGATIFGRRPEELIGRKIWEEFPGGVGGTFYAACHDAMETQRMIEVAEYSAAYDKWFENRIYPSPDGIFVYFRDVSELRKTESDLLQVHERLEHEMLHDSVTGLPTRLLFEDRLAQAIAHAPGLGRPVGVMVLDFDHFRRINERFGHAAGDLLLKEASQRLRAVLKETETLARVGGDELAVIAVHLKHDSDVAATADRLMQALQVPFDLSGDAVRLSASMGIAVYPGDGVDASTLLRHAHIATYRAKERGRNVVQMFEASMNERYRSRLEMEEDLHDAVDRGEIECFYQPIYRARDRSITGMEALVRWRHPRRGLVGPDDFIPVCEESRLIEIVGDVVIRTAAAQMTEWRRRFGPLSLSVNLSVRQFHQRNLVDSIDSALRDAAFSPSDLIVEITESVAMDNAEWTMSILRALRERGIGIAIDDFGAGQSSLIYLRQFPIGRIKIDKVFVRDILTDRTNSAIVRAVISLVHDLGLEVAAEGVETSEQLAVLDAYGCDLLQGYYFMKPMPAAEMEHELQRTQRA
jgi:diguanylate cyclase (GGDEF)-like protein/PAS domain S-box-containing protein